MKIVVLDCLPLDQGDLDWSPFEQIGDLHLYDRTRADQILERCHDATIILSNKVILNRNIIEKSAQLKLIQIMATGTNMVDLDVATEKGIAVCNVPAYSTNSVVEHVFSLLLELMRGTSEHAHKVAQGQWAQSRDFSFFTQPIVDLAGKHLGLIGSGETGQAVARVAQAFGMKVSFAIIPGRPGRSGFIDLDALLPQIDILSLHCPLTDLTEKLINEKRLRLMPEHAYLINAARGPIIDEQALAKILNEGHLKGVGLDVLSQEPPPQNHPLIRAPRCLITPHIAWGSINSRQTLIKEMFNNITAWQSGQPINQVT